jgi:hypothetical protein
MEGDPLAEDDLKEQDEVAAGKKFKL